ncbi:MAG: endonuclease NucS [Candidatus Thalassarchaeaceae archaeon]|nr:endonuclease NucS [Candidatus Thalassarchaeaceae archaeon]
MSEIKLFRISGGDTVELRGGSMSVEKELQSLLERHLEAFLGARFLATEYSTGRTHRGRIDTLGLDENNAPVIIEYKRRSDENVMSQGLFYLDWLMDHRAEFELLVTKELGEKTSEMIDWSVPRLVCIASDFNRYDEHAVKQIDRNIDLIRYQHYPDGYLVLELVNSTTSTVAVAMKTDDGSSKPVNYKTVSQYLEGAKDGLRSLYGELREHLLGLGEDTQEKITLYYFAFKRIRNFACVEVYTREEKLLVHLKVDPDTVEIEEGFTRDVREIGHFGTGELEVTLRSTEDLERAKPLIALSYEAS